MATTISDHIPASVRYGVNSPSIPRATPIWLSATKNSGSIGLQLIRAIRPEMAAVNCETISKQLGEILSSELINSESN